MFVRWRLKPPHLRAQDGLCVTHMAVRLLFISVLAAAPFPATARGFVPNFANGFGFLVPQPTSGGVGCGYFNYLNCFPRVVSDLRSWSGQLEAVYASPAAYEPVTKVSLQTPKDAKAAAADIAAMHTYPASDVAHDKEVPVMFLQDTRGDVFAEASAMHVPDAAGSLDTSQTMSDAALALQNAAVMAMTPGAEHISGHTTVAWMAAKDRATAVLYHNRG